MGAERRAGAADLDEGGSGRLGCAHRGFVLGARGCVKVHRNASRHDDRSVIEEIQLAGDAEDDRQRGDEEEEGNPAAFQAEAAAGKPERAHRIALNDRRMAVDPVHGEPEEQGAAGLPAKVEPPAEPDRLGP